MGGNGTEQRSLCFPEDRAFFDRGLGDRITHSCYGVKETDLLISASADNDNPLTPQAPCWNLPPLHILTVTCLTLHRS